MIKVYTLDFHIEKNFFFKNYIFIYTKHAVK